MAVLDVVINIGLIAVLTFLSQTFTGLNIGLMSLDTAQLQVLIDVPNKDEAALQSAKCARRILPLRRRGNLLLCTILLGNTAVNAVMAVLLSNIAGGFVGFVISTAIIVILCEIVPQSLCTRHGLTLGAMGAPIIQLAMILFYPITKPYAIVLDYLFPQRENMLDRSQLRELVEYQKSAQPNMLARGQAEMLIGALGYAEKTVDKVMVPLERTFAIERNRALDYDQVAVVVQKGFSRVPVLNGETGQVEGLLHCKDILKQRFLHAERPAETDGGGKRTAPQTAGELLGVLQSLGQERKVFACGKNTTLMALLQEFKRRPHLAVVTDSEEVGEATDNSCHIGIVTLQNIFQTILQGPVEGFTEQTITEPKLLLRQAGIVSLFDPHGLEESKTLGINEAEAVLTFLVSTDPAFFENQVGRENLLDLLRELQPVRLSKRDVLYQRNEMTTFGTLVLNGAVGVVSGDEGFESTVGPLTCLGMRALDPDRGRSSGRERTTSGSSKESAGPGDLEEGRQGSKSAPYVPDFTATVLTETCVVLRIDRKRYLVACLKASRSKS